MTKIQYEPVAKNLGDSSEYFYEFGAYQPDYNKPMPKKLEDLNQKIAKRVAQEKLRLKNLSTSR